MMRFPAAAVVPPIVFPVEAAFWALGSLKIRIPAHVPVEVWSPLSSIVLPWIRLPEDAR